MKVTKKLWAWLLCLTMISAFIPNITFAANSSSTQWTYSIFLRAADANESGTGNNLNVKLYYGSNSYLQKDLGGVSTDSYTETKYIETNVAPWQLTGLTITNPGNNAVCIDYVYLGVKAKNNASSQYYIRLAKLDGGNTWIETQNGSKHDKSKSWTLSIPDELSVSLDNLATNLGGTTVLDVSKSQSSSAFSVIWDGTNADSFMTSYNMFDYMDYPEVSVSVAAKGLSTSQAGTGYKTYSASQLGITTYTGKTNSTSKKVGFSIESKAKLLETMNNLEVNYITITSEIKFKAGRTTNNTGKDYTVKRTYTFVRNVFDIGEPTFSENFSEPHITDYNYYNIDNEESGNGITVTVPITYGGTGNFSHLNKGLNTAYSVKYRAVSFNAKLKVDDGKNTVYINSSLSKKKYRLVR